MFFEYKSGLSAIPCTKEKIDKGIVSISNVQSMDGIDFVLDNLVMSIEKHDLNGILSSLVNLEQRKHNEFSLEAVKFFNLFECLFFLYNLSNQEIQNHSIIALNSSLNNKTIPYSMEFNIIFFLINVINSGKQSLGFPAIQSLSKIAAYSNEYHDKVVFHLASLNLLQNNNINHVNIQEDQKKINILEYNIRKNQFGFEKCTPYIEPGIQPEENNQHSSNEIERIKSLQNLSNYIKYNDNQQTFICIPSLNLIFSLLKYELNPAISSFCLETLISLIPFSDIDTLQIILKSLCALSEKKKELWAASFQQSCPSSWLAPLFRSNEIQKSTQNTKFLMLFILNVIQKGEIIEGFPFDLLIDKLQYEDDKSFVATCAASAIDSIFQNDRKLIDTFINLNLLPITLNIYPNMRFNVKGKFISYLARIVQFGCLRHKLMLIKIGIIPFLVEFLLLSLSADEDLLFRTILAIKLLFECAQTQNILNVCFNQIKDSIDQIIEFQYHENKCISNITKLFIDEFFSKRNDDEYDYDDDTPVFNF